MKMKRSLVFTFAILFLLANSVLVSAITGSMGNARMILYPEVNGWTNTVIEKSISITNVNDMPINITLALDSNATKFIELIDETFILQPEENKAAQFEIRVKKEGRYDGKINVFFRPVNGTEGGVVLSSTIIVIAKKDQGYEEDNTDTDTNPDTDNTGEVDLGGEEKKPVLSNLVKFWGASTLVLLLILLALLYILSKKRGRSKRKKKRY